MIDREKVIVVLRRRFPAARPEDIATAANAIVGLEPEYQAIEAAEIHRLECLAGRDAFTTADVTAGRLRLYRRG